MKINNKGFTLIEVICSVALFAIIVTASASFFSTAAVSQKTSKQLLYANNLAQEIIEESTRNGDTSSKTYMKSGYKYYVEINAVEQSDVSSSGGDPNATPNPESTPYELRFKPSPPPEGTSKPGTDGEEGDDSIGAPDKFSYHFDCNDYIDEDLYPLYYAASRIGKDGSNEIYTDESLYSIVSAIDFSKFPTSLGNTTHANKVYAILRSLTKDQIYDMGEYFRTLYLDDFYTNYIKNTVASEFYLSSRCPDADSSAIGRTASYWQDFNEADGYIKNQYAAVEDWFYSGRAILDTYGMNIYGTYDNNNHTKPSYSEILTAIQTSGYTPKTCTLNQLATYYEGFSIADIVYLCAGTGDPICRANYQISRMQRPDGTLDDTYENSPRYIFKAFHMLNNGTVVLDKINDISRYTQGVSELTCGIQIYQGTGWGAINTQNLPSGNNGARGNIYSSSNPTPSFQLSSLDQPTSLFTIYEKVGYANYIKNIVIYLTGTLSYSPDIKYGVYTDGGLEYTDAEGKKQKSTLNLIKDYTYIDSSVDFVLKADPELEVSYDPPPGVNIHNPPKPGATPEAGTNTHGVTNEEIVTYLNFAKSGTNFYTVTVRENDENGKVLVVLNAYGIQSAAPSPSPTEDD